MEFDFKSKDEQRKFGIVMAVAIPVLGCIRTGLHWYRGEEVSFPVYFVAVGAIFLGLGLVAPKLLQPLLYVWIKFALALNWIMTRVMLSIVFYLMMTPGRLLIRIFGQDPLKRDWQADLDTFWETPEEAPREFDRYKDQF